MFQRKAVIGFAGGLCFSAANVLTFILLTRSLELTVAAHWNFRHFIAAAIVMAVGSPVVLVWYHLYFGKWRVGLVFLMAAWVVGVEQIMMAGLTCDPYDKYHKLPETSAANLHYPGETVILVAALLSAATSFIAIGYNANALNISRMRLNSLFLKLSSQAAALREKNSKLEKSLLDMTTRNGRLQTFLDLINLARPTTRMYMVNHLLQDVPPHAADITLAEVMAHPVCLEWLKDHAQISSNLESIDFVLAVNTYTEAGRDKRRELGIKIVNEFVAQEGATQVNISHALQQNIMETILQKKSFPSDLFAQAAKEVRMLIEANVLISFQQSEYWSQVSRLCTMQRGQMTASLTGDMTV
jgi:hypothetical protein